MIKEYENHSLLPYNTFGIDVTASRFVEYETADELGELLSRNGVGRPFLHIGGGSNLLFAEDYRGTVLHSAIRGIQTIEDTPQYVILRVGAGVVWDDFVAYCAESNLYGAENLSDIPGEVGASAVQNIGAYGAEVKDLVCRVETIDINGVRRTYDVGECGYSYRDSIFKQPGMEGVFVTHVLYKLDKQEHYTLDYGTVREELQHRAEISLQTVRETIIDIRARKLPDPKVTGNAGSFFMNPVVSTSKFRELLGAYPGMPYYTVDEERVKIPAGWLIEQCGWKGKSLGPAAVHDRQALVLVNKGNATGGDIIRLSEEIRQSVGEKFGIEIRPEVKIIRN